VKDIQYQRFIAIMNVCFFLPPRRQDRQVKKGEMMDLIILIARQFGGS
jgi:hypothetical protein